MISAFYLANEFMNILLLITLVVIMSKFNEILRKKRPLKTSFFISKQEVVIKKTS